MSVELERRAREPRGGARGDRRGGGALRAGAAGAVELLAAVKYVAPEDLPVLAEAGIELVGENRVEQLLAKQAAARDRFTWDFIGHLQSRKARDLVGRVRLVHSLSTLSAAERLDARAASAASPAWSRSTSRARTRKEGLAPAELDAFLEARRRARARARRGADDDAAAGGGPGGRPGRHFAALRELAGELRRALGAARTLRRASRWARARTTRSPSEEGATIVRLDRRLYRRSSV